MRILVFGDSIGYGSWDSQGGWVERIKRKAHTATLTSSGQSKIQVLNLGIGGNTSSSILNRLESETESRKSASWEFCFIFAFGTNDERTINGSVETPLDKFIQNIKEVVEISRKYSDKILFVGPPPLQDSMLDFNVHQYSDERINRYDQALKQTSAELGISYLSTRPLFEKIGKEGLYCFDRLHPNDNGHAVIEKLVTPKIEELTGVKFNSN